MIKTAETEVALAARAIDGRGAATTAVPRGGSASDDIVHESDEWLDVRGRAPTVAASRRFPYLAVLGGALGVVVLVVLVFSVLTVSDESRRPAVEVSRSPSSPAVPSATTAAPPTFAAPPLPAAPLPPAENAAPPPGDLPPGPAQPSAQMMAPQPPLLAETIRPEPPPPPPPSPMFPRLHEWFPRLFPNG